MKEDIHYIRWLWSDPETMEAVGGPHVLTEDQAERWYESMIDPGRPMEYYRLIFDGDGKSVGEVSFHDLDRDTMKAMFNLKIAPPEHGKGYGRTAMLLFLD